MKFSVLIPSFKRPQLVMEAIKSALAFVDEEDEILVSDDCSSLDEIAASFKHFEACPNIKFVFQEKNIGINGNYNFLIESANSDYSIILDDDDFFLEGVRSADIKTIIRDSGVDVVFSQTQRSYRDIEDIEILSEISGPKFNRVFEGGEILELWFREHPDFTGRFEINTQGLFIRTDLLKSIKFDPKCTYSADVRAWLKAAELGSKFMAISKPLVCYRVHSISVSAGPVTANELQAWLENYYCYLDINWGHSFKARINKFRVLWKSAQVWPGYFINLKNFNSFLGIRGFWLVKFFIFLSCCTVKGSVKFFIGNKPTLYKKLKKLVYGAVDAHSMVR